MADVQHKLRSRDHGGHMKSIWCSCGWSAGVPQKFIRKADVKAAWQSHLEVIES